MENPELMILGVKNTETTNPVDEYCKSVNVLDTVMELFRISVIVVMMMIHLSRKSNEKLNKK